MEDTLILCINCEVFVSYKEIMAHSKECLIPSVAAMLLIDGYGINHIDFRIERLKDAMELAAKVKHDDKVLVNIYWYLIRQASEIISVKIPTTSTLNICMRINQKVYQYEISHENPQVFLYLERLKLLCKEKFKILDEGISYSRLDSSEYPSEIVNHKSLLGANKFSILTIDSAMDDPMPHRRQNSSLISPSSYASSQVSSLNILSPSSFNSSQEFSFNSTSQLSSPVCESTGHQKCKLKRFPSLPIEDPEKRVKRKFYSKCLKLQAMFSTRVSQQSLLIASLYLKAKERGLRFDEWENFIFEEFQTLENGF